MYITYITNCLLQPVHISLTRYQSDTPVHAHTYIHTNLSTITRPSLSYFLFPCCFSMLSLSLMQLLTCGVIRPYNLYSHGFVFRSSRRETIAATGKHLATTDAMPSNCRFLCTDSSLQLKSLRVRKSGAPVLERLSF